MNRNYERGDFRLLAGGRAQAEARLHGSEKYPDIRGTVRFYRSRNGVFVLTEVSGLPDGPSECAGPIFGFHIHNGMECTGNPGDPFANTGGHYNPHNCLHPYHAGDMSPLFGRRRRGVFMLSDGPVYNSGNYRADGCDSRDAGRFQNAAGGKFGDENRLRKDSVAAECAVSEGCTARLGIKERIKFCEQALGYLDKSSKEYACGLAIRKMLHHMECHKNEDYLHYYTFGETIFRKGESIFISPMFPYFAFREKAEPLYSSPTVLKGERGYPESLSLNSYGYQNEDKIIIDRSLTVGASNRHYEEYETYPSSG